MLSLVVLIIITGFIATNANQHTVSSPAGDIIGYEYDSVLFPGKKAVQFLGIPFAKPPIGNLRFAKPVQNERFTESFNASKYGYSCIQVANQLGDFFAKLIIPNEDCLTLNVFVPVDALNGNKKAVMVFIYGGGFVLGSSAISGGEHLALFGDVIVVTMNYRVGPLGFLNTGVDDAPSNVGLWDQRLALQWTNKNIESFGGLKDKVTIFGESAGAASVTYQMMFSGNEGLFGRAIAESGSLAAFWASTNATTSRNLANELSSKVGCADNHPNFNSRIVCMRKVDAMKLHLSGLQLMQDGTMRFAPERDDNFIKFDPERCIDQTSDCARNMLDIEYMSGINDFDGLVVASFFLGPRWKTDGMSEEDFRTRLIGGFLPWLNLEGQINAELVKYRYTDHTSSSDIVRLHQASNLLTDLQFTYPFVIVSDIAAALGRKSYVYKYGHKLFGLSEMGPLIPGAGHAEELAYVFGFPRDVLDVMNVSLTTIPQSERNYSQTVMTYWTNFAKTGNPNEPETEFRPSIWPEYNNETKEFLDFGRTYDGIIPGSHMYADRVAFWRDLIPAITKAMPEKQMCSVSSVDSFTSNLLSVVSLVLTTLTLIYV